MVFCCCCNVCPVTAAASWTEPLFNNASLITIGGVVLYAIPALWPRSKPLLATTCVPHKRRSHHLAALRSLHFPAHVGTESRNLTVLNNNSLLHAAHPRGEEIQPLFPPGPPSVRGGINRLVKGPFIMPGGRSKKASPKSGGVKISTGTKAKSSGRVSNSSGEEVIIINPPGGSGVNTSTPPGGGHIINTPGGDGVNIPTPPGGNIITAGGSTEPSGPVSVASAASLAGGSTGSPIAGGPVSVAHLTTAAGSTEPSGPVSGASAASSAGESTGSLLEDGTVFVAPITNPAGESTAQLLEGGTVFVAPITNPAGESTAQLPAGGTVFVAPNHHHGRWIDRAGLRGRPGLHRAQHQRARRID